MWRNKTHFKRECSRICKERKWVSRARRGDTITLEPALQREILGGFRLFYPRHAPKR